MVKIDANAFVALTSAMEENDSHRKNEELIRQLANAAEAVMENRLKHVQMTDCPINTNDENRIQSYKRATASFSRSLAIHQYMKMVVEVLNGNHQTAQAFVCDWYDKDFILELQEKSEQEDSNEV